MVDAHGYMTTPLAEFNPGVMKTSFSAKMDPVFPGKFNDNPQANAKTFTEAFNSPSNDKYKTLQDLLNGQGPECGYTNPNVSPKPIPADGVVVWQNPDSGEGFVPSHTVSKCFSCPMAMVVGFLVLSMLTMRAFLHHTGTVRAVAGRQARV